MATRRPFTGADAPSIRLIDQCIQCGQCLETCPTYSVTRREDASPRGRLWLMRKAADGELEISPTFRDQMWLCLDCRACETACPVGVQFGRLMEESRGEVARTLPQGPFERAWKWLLLRAVLPNRPALRVAGHLARAWRSVDPRGRLAARLPGIIRRLTGIIPSRSTAPFLPARDGSAGPAAGEPVVFFSGCIMPEMFGGVHRATIEVLGAAGYRVRTPARQGCCGALHAHAGEREPAKALARHLIAALGEGSEPIVLNSAGCGAMLKEYRLLFEHDPEWRDRAARFSARVRDVSQMLAGRGLPFARPLERTVTYDAPCHLLHGQKVSREPLDLLRAVPGIRLVPLPDADRCCGSAGIYNLLQPVMADELLRQKVEAIRATGAGTVATGNPGCLLQIDGGLRAAGVDVSVVHPLELVAEALRRDGEGASHR